MRSSEPSARLRSCPRRRRPSALRSLLVGSLSLLAFIAVAANAATAAVSVNAVTTTATATGAVSLIDTTGVTTQITCRSSQIVDAISTNGSGTISTRGGVSFSGCTLGLIVTQNAQWTSSTTLRLNGSSQITAVQTVVTVPSGALDLSAPVPGCSFELAGTVTARVAVTPIAPPSLAGVASIAGTDFPTPAGLVVSSVASNSLCPAIQSGDLVGFAAPYNLNPAIGATLI